MYLHHKSSGAYYLDVVRVMWFWCVSPELSGKIGEMSRWKMVQRSVIKYICRMKCILQSDFCCVWKDLKLVNQMSIIIRCII